MLKREHWKFSETLSRAHPNLKLLIWLTQIAICGIVLLAAPRARSQTEPAFSLASRSSIVVLGTVAKINASEESLLKPSRSTVVITLKRMFAYLPVIRQAGQQP